MYVSELFQKQVEAVLKKAGVAEPKLEKPPAGIGADLAFPCFELAKAQKKNPAEIAQGLGAKIKAKDLIGKISTVGPYVNFYINAGKFGQLVLQQALKGDYGKQKIKGKAKTAVVDFSSPNPVHPFHMGTLRSTLIGESLCRILEFSSWRTKRICYINDIGKQAATALLGYSKWDGKPSSREKPDVWLGRIYLRIHKAMDEKMELQAYDMLRRYEIGDKKIRAMGKKIFSWTLKSFKRDWNLLDIKFDNIVWESQLVAPSKKIIQALKKRGLVFESKGALILDLEKQTSGALPSTVILRGDGTGLYLTRDIPLAIWKARFKPSLNIYVVGEDQALHFKQLFTTLELLGHKKLASVSQHLSYSLVTLEGKKMSARRGWLVLWDELLAEGKKRAAAEVAKRWPSLSKVEKEKRAEKIALGAIIYFILKYSPEKIVDFVWKSALAFEGATGPYLQYSYARAKSILRKGKIKKIGRFNAGLLTDKKEQVVVKKIAAFPEIVADAAKNKQPHLVANFTLELADAFNEFYQTVPVLKAEKGKKSARLALVSATGQVLKNALWLLGIPVLEQM